MTENTLHDDFMALGDMTEIDNRILAEAGQDDLIDKMGKQKEEQTEARTPWYADIRSRWLSYSFMALSFLLTEMLSIYIGLAPEKRANPDGSGYVYWHNDAGHLLTALVYMLVFPIVTEVAFLKSWDKYRKAETGNFAQHATMIASVFISFISIVGTGVAGAYVIFSTLGSIGFVSVPHSAQNWLIWVIPSLLAIFGTLHQIYDSKSKYEKSKKLADEQKRNNDLNDGLRMQQIEQAGRRAIRAAAIKSYEQSIALGLLSEAEARAALAQGKSLLQLERELNRDLTGEGKVGDTSGLRLPPPSKPVTVRDALGLNRPLESSAPKAREYTLAELLSFLGVSPDQAVEALRRNNLDDAQKAYSGLRAYIPEDMTFENFKALYVELLQSVIIPRVQEERVKASGNGGSPF